MRLNCLCFVLPADSDEIEPPQETPSRTCGHQLMNLVCKRAHWLYESGWIRFRGPVKKHHSGVFFDLDGVDLSSKKVGKESPRILSYSELYIGSKGFSEDEVLGSGGFGKVYRAVLPSDGTVVAVKCLAEKGERFERTFAAELVAVAHLRHRNLVRLRGWCVYEDRLLLVYDYMPNRSLDRVLFRRLDNLSPTATLGWERRRNIVGGLAAALNYLHGQLETQIIHRDVKTSNVMLDSQFNARLGDFGLARWLEHEFEYQHQTATNSRTTSRNSYQQFHLADTTKMGGTIGYLPPESFQKQSFATAKSDVFSFGIVVLEVASGRRAVDISYPEDKIVLLDWVRRMSDQRKLLEAADPRLPDGSFGLSDMERVIHLGLLCTLHNPQSRPTMKWVVEALSGDVSGKLPSLPSFQSQPLYISLSSSSDTSRSTTANVRSSITSTTMCSNSAATFYVSAHTDTIYESAEKEVKDSEVSSTDGPVPRRVSANFVVETPREISYKELASATDNFADSRRVAELDFGTAYHGYLNNNRHILVKRLGMTKCPALVARFSNELHNLGRLRHRSLVQLRGWCTDQGEMLVVYDYSSNLLLSHCLFHHADRGKIASHTFLRWRKRYNIVKSVASAILYLHEEWDEQVIHRNITSSAIILDPDMNPRLSSFALAEFLTRNDHEHHAAHNTREKSLRGIFGYLAPEYVESGEATPMNDIYSFGVVILEVVTGQMAVDFRRPEALLVRKVRELEARRKTLTELVDIRLKEEYDPLQLKRLVELGIACTRSDPKLRPNIRQIISVLDGNDKRFVMRKDEGIDQWKQRNEHAVSLVRSMQALGIQ
ncbi:hypothetical protein MLD38_036286 [Melastoma candidum]|uniref:Uncharacterized protein n=1 Tax=Melastoma candidum TaxID=119954 RepID=A0ACB9LJG8_9MYRT|nr:hypothetical protein MLD38_036286 [Melastoma candidum]